MSSLYDSAQAPVSNDAQFYPSSSSSVEKAAPQEHAYRWYHPSSALPSSSPAMDESLSAQHHFRAVEPPLTSSHDHRISQGQRPNSFIPHNYTSASQHVRSSVNTRTPSHPSTVPRNLRPSSAQLESHLSRPTPFHHVSITQSRQPPSQVSPELIAHYGVPQLLTRPSQNQQVYRSAALPDLQSLKDNYLSMLSQKPIEKTTSMLDNTTASEPVDPAATSASAPPEKMDDELLSNLDSVVEAMLASPEYRAPSGTFEEFLTSPFDNSTPYDDFNSSPLDDSPFNADLNTPIMNDISDDFGMYTSEYSGLPLFNDDASSLYQLPADSEVLKKPDSVPELLDSAKLYTMSPSTPSLDALNPTTLYHAPRIPAAPTAPPPSASASPELTFAPEPEPTTRRRSSATGTRKNITPASLIPLDAPTQTRKYVTPSATSRKDVPAVFAKKKRSRSQAFDEEDELAAEEAKPLNASEKEQIEWKRRQNTLSARKSRKRKLEQLQSLNSEVDKLKNEKEVWRSRAMQYAKILESHDIPFERFEE